MKKMTLILIATCLLLPVGQLLAKKPVCPSPHPSCDGDDETPLPVTEVDNFAKFTGFVTESEFAAEPSWDLEDGLPRLCLVSVIQENDGQVNYECDSGGRISINFSGWVETSGRESGYCDLLDTTKNTTEQKFREFTPTRYWYRNNAACDPGPDGCNIRIAQWVFRGQRRGPGTDTGDTHQYFNLGDDYGLNDIGLIRIVAFAKLTRLEDDGNVYSVDQDMNLQDFQVEFVAAGKNKSLAVCRVQQPDNFTLGQAQLNTQAIIPPP